MMNRREKDKKGSGGGLLRLCGFMLVFSLFFVLSPGKAQAQSVAQLVAAGVALADADAFVASVGEAAAQSLITELGIGDAAQLLQTVGAPNLSSLMGAIDVPDIGDIIGAAGVGDFADLINNIGIPDIGNIVDIAGAADFGDLLDEIGVADFTSIVGNIGGLNLGGLIDELGVGDLTNVIDGLGIPDLSGLINQIGVFNFGDLFDDFDIAGIQNLIGEFGIPDLGSLIGQIGIGEFTDLIGSIGIPGIQDLIGSIGIPSLAGLIDQFGLAGFENILGELGMANLEGLLDQIGVGELSELLGAVGLDGITDLIGELGLDNLAGLLDQIGVENLTGLIANLGLDGLNDLISQVGIDGVGNLINALGLDGVIGEFLAGGIGGLVDLIGGGLIPGVIGGIPFDQDTWIPSLMQPAHEEALREILEDLWIPTFQEMATQFTATMMHQIYLVGTLLDARNQLETQLAFQKLSAEAHKDYQPDMMVCQFGTTTKSLERSERKARLNARVLYTALFRRDILSSAMSTADGPASDLQSRFEQFQRVYCDVDDANGYLANVCGAGGPMERVNRDINYTELVDRPKTVDMNFEDNDTSDYEEDIMALGRNLFNDHPLKRIPIHVLEQEAAPDDFQDMRSLFAIRSVAENSFAQIVGMKAAGSGLAAPFLQTILFQMGVPNEDDPVTGVPLVENFLRSNPSYFAQMEMLTHTMYQNPQFYTNLYTQPANLDRIGVSLQAIKLMQDRDRFEAALRREMLISLILELKLRELQENITSQIVPNIRLQAPGG